MKRINLPLTEEIIADLRVNEKVLLTGFIYTARDMAHKRLVDAIDSKQSLPLDLANQILFYAGPAQTPPNQVIGSIGPTTASRMDNYTTALLEVGLKGCIGKGRRSSEVLAELRKHHAIYFVAIGGVAALQSKCVKMVEEIAYDDLGTESIKKLWVEDFPVFVGSDSYGGYIYE